MDKLIYLFLTLSSLLPLTAQSYLFDRDSQSGDPVRLNVTAENPKVYFSISGDAPQFKSKEKFLDGKYSTADDQTFFREVVMEAMQQWTDVQDSYVELILSSEIGPGRNSEDNINNISISSGTWSDAGSAMPIRGTTESNRRHITDCDILLDPETDPEIFSNTVLHELGHCLGLLHPHYSSKSIMSYANRGQKFKLTLDDKAGITVLYPMSYEKRRDLIPVCGVLSSRRQNLNTFSLSMNVLFLLLPSIFAVIVGKNSKQTLLKFSQLLNRDSHHIKERS